MFYSSINCEWSISINMRWFTCLSVFLLALMLTIGSLMNTSIHQDLVSEKSENCHEIEGSFDYQITVQRFNSIQYPVHIISLLQLNSHSQIVMSTCHLLRSHRIALPPPLIS